MVGRNILLALVTSLVLLSGFLYFTRFEEKDPNPRDITHVTAGQVIIQECGKSDCSFTVKKGTSSYKSVSTLNPETQTFTARLFVTDSLTTGMNGGIVWVGSGYVTVDEGYSVFGEKLNRRVENISASTIGDYRWYYWSSSIFEVGIVVVFIVLAIIAIVTTVKTISDTNRLVGNVASGATGTFEKVIEALGDEKNQKKIKKFVKQVDKERRRNL